jgi:phytoene desaturase
MSKKSMIIIGGGLGGLSTGCYAEMYGYKSHIFEQHSIPCGLCTAWYRKGFTIDGCIHFLVGCQPQSPFYSMYQELGILEHNHFKIIKDFNSCIDEKTGINLLVTSDLQSLWSNMKKIAPEDEIIIDEFIHGCQSILKIFRNSSAEIVKFRRRYNMTVAEFAKSFQNHILRRYITYLCIPEMPMYSMFMCLGLLAYGQLGLVEGGSLSFSNMIVQKYKELGGEITLDAYVEEILIENNTAVGIRLSDGRVYPGDLIVSAADGFSTIYQMLGGKYIDQNIRDLYDHSPLLTPLNIISFGVARQFLNEQSEMIILLDKPLNTGGKNVEEIRLRIFNNEPSFAPEGKTVVQALIYTNFDYWFKLHEKRTIYEEEKRKVADSVIQRLENLFPSISTLIEMTDVATPYTLWRYTRNHRGSWEGWLPTPEMVRKTIPNTLPGLNNFYMTGQWVLPAAGIPQVLNSGRNLVKILTAQES